MTENEAIKQLKYMYKTCMDEKCRHKGECDLCCEARDIAIKALEEIQQYRAIGTVEEIKTLKEKSEPKKLEIEKFWGYDDLMCPNCKSYKIRNPKYCCDCGQALDWD